MSTFQTPILGFGALFLVVMATGCSRPETSAPITQHPWVKPITITVITNNRSNYGTASRLGAQAAVRQLANVTVDFHLLADTNEAKQKSYIDDAIASGSNGIAISSLDAVNQKKVIDDAASRVPVFTLGNDAPESNRACYVGPDNVDAGRMAGRLLARSLPHGGDIIVLGSNSQSSVDRLKGLRRGLQALPIHIIDVRTDGEGPTQAKANAATALVHSPRLAGMVGLSGYDGPAILSAVKDANKVGKVRIVAFDSDIQTLDGIKQGQIFGTVVEQPFQFTQNAVERIAKYIRGDKIQIPASKRIIMPDKTIDRSNVDALLGAASRKA